MLLYANGVPMACDLTGYSRFGQNDDGTSIASDHTESTLGLFLACIERPDGTGAVFSRSRDTI